MRAWMLVVLLLGLASPARAHDWEYGFASCYDERHCFQDTLVLGLVTHADRDGYTVGISRVLQSNHPLTAGTDLRIARAPASRPYGDTPKVGRPILVSFLRKGQQPPYAPRHLARMTSTDYRITHLERCPGSASYLEGVIHQGGEPCRDRQLGLPPPPLHEHVTIFLRTHTPTQVKLAAAAVVALPLLLLGAAVRVTRRRVARHRLAPGGATSPPAESLETQGGDSPWHRWFAAYWSRRRPWWW